MNTVDPRAADLFEDCSEIKPRVDQEQLADTIIRFWADLQGPSEGSMGLVSGFLIGRRLHGMTRRSFCMPDEREAAGAWVAKEASLGRDVYMKPMVQGTDGGKAPIWAVGAEVDRSRLAILPRPSMSLTVTATRVQCYWKLDYAISSSDAEKLVQRLMWSQDRPMMLPGMPDNRGFGAGCFECPECLPLTYSYEDLAHGFPNLKTSGPTWEPGILRPIDVLSQRAGVVAAIFGGGALRAGMASAAAAVAAIGGFMIPNPSVSEPPVRSETASDLSAPPVSVKDPVTSAISIPISRNVSAPAIQPIQVPQSRRPDQTPRSRLQAAKEEGRAQVEQIKETDEVGMVLGSGGALTRDTFDRSTTTIFESQP